MPEKFDLSQSLEDFELVGRMRLARKFPQLAVAQSKLSAEQLGPIFKMVAEAVAEGLSLRSAGALAGVSHRVLALWIRRADDAAEPYARWLATLLKRDAEWRRQALRDLRQLSLGDAGAQRELIRQVGVPSALEKELDLLRRSKTATADAYFAPVDAARDFAERNPPPWAEKPAGDVQSVGKDGIAEGNDTNCTEPSVEGRDSTRAGGET